MCSVGGARGSWTSGEVFQEINSLLNRLGEEDLNSVPAESMGDDQIALQRIVNRVQAEDCAGFGASTAARVTPLPER